MKMTREDFAYFILPALLWPIVFIALRSKFVYAMLVAALCLAAFTLYGYRDRIKFSYRKANYASILLLGIIGSVALYLAFLIGYYATVLLGLSSYVSSIYTMLYSQGAALAVAPILILIGISEEIYWRGGLQGYIRKNSKVFANKAWLGSALWYGAVHLLTLNPILALSAFVVGIITGLIAERYGILVSSVTHIIWLIAIVLVIPIGI